MTISIPPEISALPNTITPDVTTGLDDHLEAVYDFLKTLPGLIDAEIAQLTLDSTAAAPPGTIAAFGGGSVPTGWLLCAGSAVSRTTYAALFAAISTSYGVGDGSTTFNLPDAKGRALVGRDGTQTEFDSLGETGGAKTVALIADQMPTHGHAINLNTQSHSHNHTFSGKGDSSTNHSHNQGNTAATGGTGDSTNGTVTTGSEGHTHAVTGNSNNVGAGQSHQNMPPYIVVNYIIKE